MFDELAEKIKELEGKTLMVIDYDEDGKASGFLMKKILENKEIDFDMFIKYNFERSMKKIEKLVKNYENVIFLDSPFDNNFLLKIAKENPNVNFIYIDHHKRDIVEEKNLYFFDLEAKGIYNLCTTSIVYRIGKILYNFEKYSLQASFGAVGDYVFQYDDLIKEDLQKNYPQFYNGYFTPVYMLIFNVVSHLSVKKAIEFMEDLEFNKDIINNYTKRIKNLLDQFKSVKIVYESNKIIVLEAKSSKFIANYYKTLYPDKVIVVLSKLKMGLLDNFILRYYKASLRGNCGDLGKIASEFPYKITGGGHKNAAGISFHKKYLDKFIKYLEEKC